MKGHNNMGPISSGSSRIVHSPLSRKRASSVSSLQLKIGAEVREAEP